MPRQVWQKGAKAQANCQIFQAVDVKVTFLFRLEAENPFAVAQRPPT